MVTRPGEQAGARGEIAGCQGRAHLEVAAQDLGGGLLSGGAVDVDALDQRPDGGGGLDGVPPHRAVLADHRRHPAAAARASTSSSHSGGHGLSRSVLRRSWSSSGVVGAGSISARTRSIASWVTRPISWIVVGRPRRRDTALVRRSMASPSSRNAYGLTVRISWASSDGSVESTKWKRTSPASTCSHRATSPSQSSASVRQSCTAWRGSGWSGTSIGPVTFSWQAAAPGEHRGEQVVALHALEVGRHPLPAPEAQDDEAAVEVPPPTALEDRLVEDGLLQRGLDRLRGEEPGHVGQREAVVRPEGDDDGVVVGAGLELEVEPGAELLAQRVPHGPVEAAAVRRVDHELHPARLVEEPLDDEVVLRGHDAEHRPRPPPGR